MKLHRKDLWYLLEAAAVSKLRGTEYRVLLYLIPRLSFEMYQPINRRELRDRLALKKENLSVALGTLIVEGFLCSEKLHANGKNLLFRLPRAEELQEALFSPMSFLPWEP